MAIEFSIKDFRESLSRGFLNPPDLGYDYLDPDKYCRLFGQYEKDSKRIKSPMVFDELCKRMSRKYYQEVFLAQLKALHFASRYFPAYAIIMPEDLAEDWLATVDFHKKFARDHSLHQPLTAYVVAKLLGFGDERLALPVPMGCGNLLGVCADNIVSGKHSLQEYAISAGLPGNLFANSVLARSFWKNMFYKTAVLSALFHDIGYPWQYVGRIKDSLTMSSPLLHPEESVAACLLEEMGDRLLFLPFHDYSFEPRKLAVGEKKRKEQLVKLALGTHGFPGAIAFLSLHDAIKAIPVISPLSIVHSFSIEWAALGIFMHDMVQVQQKNKLQSFRIDFVKDPLSSVVSLADYLEEFNRPAVSFSSLSSKSQLSYSYACSFAKVEISPDSVLQIEMRYNSKGTSAVAGKYKSEETEDYFNLSSGFIDLSSLGIRDISFRYF